MKTAYLVYKPILEYEDSIDPYCICLSKEDAEAAQNKIIDWYKNIIKKLPEEPDESIHWMDDEEETTRKKEIHDNLWIAAHEKSEKVKEKFFKKKPFENIMTYKIPSFGSGYESPESWVGIMGLEIFEKNVLTARRNRSIKRI